MYKKISRYMRLLCLVTLILSTILIISVCYTYFDGSMKNETDRKAEFTASLLDGEQDKIGALEKLKNTENRITLIDGNGNILYDSFEISGENHLDRSEVKSALENGKGHSERYSKTLKKRMYYSALRLSDGSVLRFCDNADRVPEVFYTIVLAVIFIMVLMYIATATVASVFTHNIVKPISEIDPKGENLDEVYEEIRPFLKRISQQNDEIYRQMERVTEQKARLRAIMDNINEGLVIIGKNSDILSVNTPALEIFSVRENEVRYKNYSALTTKEQVLSLIKKSLSGHKGSELFEKENRTYEIFHSPVFDSESITGCVLMIFDVTERVDSEKIRKEFTANVSHELKTPLTTIHGYSQIIGSGIARPEDVGDFVKKIEKESRRLIALVDDIIKLSHLDEGSADTPKQRVSLRAVANEVMDSLSAKAEEMQVTMCLEGSDSFVTANPSQLSEMIYNLADNAIKYNKPQGKVTIRVSENLMEIADTGIGISAEFTDRIFERFFRVDKSHSKKVDGTGLGLSIVKHLALANGARIKVESTVGEGSIFKVYFDNKETFI